MIPRPVDGRLPRLSAHLLLLVAAGPLLLSSGCGSGSHDPGSHDPGAGPDEARAVGGRRGGADGAAATYRMHCSMCHGATGSGVTGLGPDLRDKGEHWDEERLLAYLRDPKGFAEQVPRLGTRPMPALANSVTDEDAGELARHVLSLMQ